MRSPSILVLTVAASAHALLGGIRHAAAARGGPDSFGYVWLDSDEPGLDARIPDFLPTDERSQGLSGDETVRRITLPGAVLPGGFLFYGTRYTEAWISSNGWLAFVSPGSPFPAPAQVPAAAAPNALIAALWDDLTLEGAVTYATAGRTKKGDGFTISMVLARASDPTVTAQVAVTLFANGDVLVNYVDDPLPLVGPQTSAGIENAAGTAGLAFLTNGVPQSSARLRSGYAVLYTPRPKLDCTAASPLSCPLAVQDFSDLGRPNWVQSYGCSGQTHGGGESVFALTLAAVTDLTVGLDNFDGRNRNAFLIGERCHEQTACLGSGRNFQTRALDPGTYTLVVDGETPADAGDFRLTLDCTASGVLSCPSPGVTINLANPQPVEGDTTGGVNTAEAYECAASAFGTGGVKSGFTGPEAVYRFQLDRAEVVSFLLESASPDLRLFLLKGCSEARCVMEGGCAESLAPGSYHLAVDGLNGAAAPYTIIPLVLPPSPRNPWHACPERGPSIDDVESDLWSFDDQTFCGTGCDFSLYAVVECGTEFHIPFWDVETGHLRIHDVLGGQDVDLTATNNHPANPGLPATCHHTDVGPLVDWEDNGCRSIPCQGNPCGGGSDCRTNEVVMDVSFQGRPTVCGVYRIDFLNWGGWEWEAYANCTATRTPQFPLFRDLCSALAAYRPLPETGFSTATFDTSQCALGNAAGSFTIENIGCLAAAQVEVTIEQVPPLPPNPQTVVVSLLPGEVKVVPYVYPVSGRPVNLLLKVDPADRLRECSEDQGTRVECGFNGQLLREWPNPGCPLTCSTLANAGPSQRVCAGEPVTLDGGASSVVCLIGPPQYRFEDAAGVALTGCDFGPSPTCAVNPARLVPGAHVFTLRTRCRDDDPPCETTSSVLVEVAANVTPPSLGNSLRMVRADQSARLSWAAILTGDPSLYRIYKAADKAVLTTRALLSELLSAETTALDEGGVVLPPQPVAYYQLVAVSCSGDLEGPY